MTRVLVLWASPSSANFGVRALAEGLSVLIREAWGDSVEINFADLVQVGSMPPFGTREVLRDVRNREGVISSTIRNYDVVIDSGGGDSFTDIYGLKRLITIAYCQKKAQKLGVPVILGPQTLGPFKHFATRKIGASCLTGASLTFARDSESAKYAAKLGVSVDEIGTDVIFSLPLPTSGPKSDVVLNVSGLLWSDNNHFDGKRFQAETKKLIEALLNSGRQVSLLPHVIAKSDVPDNDMPAIQALEKEFEKDVNVLTPQSLWEAREIISGSSLVIGSRMHSCLNALSVGVPAIPWAYSRKFLPLMEDLGWRYGIDLHSSTAAAEQTISQISEIKNEVSQKDLDEIRSKASAKLSLVGAKLSTLTEGSTS